MNKGNIGFRFHFLKLLAYAPVVSGALARHFLKSLVAVRRGRLTAQRHRNS